MDLCQIFWDLAKELAPETSKPGFQRGLSICLQAISYAFNDSTVKERNLVLNDDHLCAHVEIFRRTFMDDRFVITGNGMSMFYMMTKMDICLQFLPLHRPIRPLLHLRHHLR